MGRSNFRKHRNNCDHGSTSDSPSVHDKEEIQWPIVYNRKYNIFVGGLENLHTFDSRKWEKVHDSLIERKLLTEDQFVSPSMCTKEDLLVVHTERYLDSLNWSINVAAITEVPIVAFVPNFIVQRTILNPLKLQTSGSILASKLALEKGWAINIGGGFHHCSSDKGGGFCAFADITLITKFLYENNQQVPKILIVDLDAHQGNGYARDLIHDRSVHIMDVYNADIYPNDLNAKQRIDTKIEVSSGIKDSVYLTMVEVNLKKVMRSFKPNFIIYNAGTDILSGDPLGCMDISENGVLKRDKLMFTLARENKIPIVMLTSGGYQQNNAKIISNSIQNLIILKLIEGPLLPMS